MAAITTIAGIVDSVRRILEALRQISSELIIRGTTQDQATKKIERFNQIASAMAALDAQNTTLMNERDKLISDFKKFGVDTREVVAGIYGKDSTEYELVGGTRKSEIRGGGRGPSSNGPTSSPPNSPASG